MGAQCGGNRAGRRARRRGGDAHGLYHGVLCARSGAAGKDAGASALALGDGARARALRALEGFGREGATDAELAERLGEPLGLTRADLAALRYCGEAVRVRGRWYARRAR
jgi:hypothetical protein